MIDYVETSRRIFNKLFARYNGNYYRIHAHAHRTGYDWRERAKGAREMKMFCAGYLFQVAEMYRVLCVYCNNNIARIQEEDPLLDIEYLKEFGNAEYYLDAPVDSEANVN